MREIVLLNDMKFKDVRNLPIFTIEYSQTNIDLSIYDALIFTSKNAIYAIDSLTKEWKTIPSYCIARKTSNVVKTYEGNSIFTGKYGHGDEFAQELIPLLEQKKCLYIKASKTVSRLTAILKENNILVDEFVAYKTVCNAYQSDPLKENSIIIFTSPSSVECFFKKYVWKATFSAIVIGKTTAKYMPKNIEYIISTNQSVDSCVNLARTL